jgi:hypothetical protein
MIYPISEYLQFLNPKPPSVAEILAEMPPIMIITTELLRCGEKATRSMDEKVWSLVMLRVSMESRPEPLSL